MGAKCGTRDDRKNAVRAALLLGVTFDWITMEIFVLEHPFFDGQNRLDVGVPPTPSEADALCRNWRNCLQKYSSKVGLRCLKMEASVQ